jgi:hypothetical protein
LQFLKTSFGSPRVFSGKAERDDICMGLLWFYVDD